MRVASLCGIVSVCLAPISSAMARSDLPQPVGALPCNEMCKAWMAWSPGRPGPEVDGSGVERPVGHDAALAASPTPSIPKTKRPTDEPRLARHPAEAQARAPASRVWRALEARVPPPRPRALPQQLPPRARLATGGIEHGLGIGPVTGVTLPPADAAVLARPLYRPLDGAETPDRSADATGGRSEPPEAVVVAPVARRDDPATVERPLAPATTDFATRDIAVEGAPMAGASSRSLRAAKAALSGARAAPAARASAPPPPASDLESLDQAEHRARSDVTAPQITSQAWMAILSALILVFLIGPCRRAFTGGPR